MGKILENEIPVYVVTFATQEMLLFRNAKTREIVVGAENRVEQCHYAAVVTRVEEELDNELTGGWKVIEVRLTQRMQCFCSTLTFFVDGQEVRSCIPVVQSHLCTPQKYLSSTPLRLHPSIHPAIQ